MALEAIDFSSAEIEIGDELPVGTSLLSGQYTISRFINSGGFGITYLAKDSLNRNVVIKECFVDAYCRRTKSRVRPRSVGSKPAFDTVVRHFLSEAHRMATLVHPNIVGVRQVFEENDTAYMALDYIEGMDLLQIIEQKPGCLTPGTLVDITRKILSALGYVHEHDLLHCDISPDNIFLNGASQPILIDFGAARLLAVDGAAKNSGPLVVKDGYSPHELYFSGGKSGPWTDIYSLAAALSHCVTGEAPITSQRRLAAIVESQPDPYLPLSGRYEGYPTGYLESLDRAMAVMPVSRFQSTAEWLDVLDQLDQMESKNVKLFRRTPRPAPAEPPDQTPIPKVVVRNSPTPEPPAKKKGIDMAIDLSGLREITGFIGGCLVDSETGLMMAAEGGDNFDLEGASAANTEVVKAKHNAIKLLGLKDSIEDILITLGKQLHLIRPLENTPTVFLYVALDRKSANLGMARVQVKKVEQSVSL